MEKTKDLLKKIRDTKQTFHAKTGSIKDRKGIGQRKQKILRRGGKNTQTKRYKKDIHDPDNLDGVIIHLEPDILECELNWTLGSTTTKKASGGDRIPVELFQIPKR